MIPAAPTTAALAFLALGAAIAGWQSLRARRCSAHRRAFGWIAWGLAAGCFAAGFALLGGMAFAR